MRLAFIVPALPLIGIAAVVFATVYVLAIFVGVIAEAVRR